MKQFMSLIFVFGFVQFSAAQLPYSKSKAFKKSRSSKTNILNLEGFVGTSFGQETLIGLPKLGGHCYLNFNPKTNKSITNWGIYAGVETSLFVLFAGAFSVGVNAGIKIACFTIDCSLSKLAISSPESVNAVSRTSYNPKFGFTLGPVWIKAGPSYLIKGMDALNETLAIDRFNFNIELLFKRN